MTILYCGSSDIDFQIPLPSGFTTVTTGASRGTGWAQMSIQTSNTSGNPAKSTVFPGGAVTTAWFSCRFYHNHTSSNRPAFGMGKNGTNCGVFFGPGSAGAKVAVFKYDGSSITRLVEESGSSLQNQLNQRIDLYVENLGASSYVTLYVDNVEVIARTGVDTSLTGLTGFDVVMAALTTGTGGVYSNGSEFIVADEDTRLFSGLAEHQPTAAGDANGWDGGTYTDLDPAVAYSDTTMVYVNSTNKDAQFNLQNSPTGTYLPRMVKVSARTARTSGSTPTNIGLGVKSGGSIDYGAAQSQTVSTWAHIERYMATNPVTTNNWTTSELDALQLNIHSS